MSMQRNSILTRSSPSPPGQRGYYIEKGITISFFNESIWGTLMVMPELHSRSLGEATFESRSYFEMAAS